MEVIIKNVSIDQLGVLQALCVETFTETYASQNTKSDLDKYLETSFNQVKLESELHNQYSEFYIAYADGVPAGYLKINMGDAQTEIRDENGLEIERIYVLNSHQGKKIGQALFKKSRERALFHKADFIWLGVWEKNHKAIGFYEKIGFHTFDKHILVLGDDPQTDLMMKLDLA
ncbi:GNAT family N-acetyltransferase [Ekhidna sp. MALMAid0563]|uniref:GNAT family N-acetyltransferase n=1 Tax=Ekhidna sp. MALMAid0563 TaxID=3143937 RepID=UPI0032DF1D20